MKQKFLMQMFAGFPSSMAAGEDEIAITLAAYLELLGGFSDDIVHEACIHFRKRSTRFPPTSGEFFQKCEELHARYAEKWRRENNLYQLPKPEMSEAHRERMKEAFSELLEKLKAGKLEPKMNGFTRAELEDESFIVNRVGAGNYTMRPGRPYGYMTKAELALPRVKPIVERKVPGSWLEKWEKENGRPYYGLKDAAE